MADALIGLDKPTLGAIIALVAAFFFALSAHVQNMGPKSTSTQGGTLVLIGTQALIYSVAALFIVKWDYWMSGAVVLFAAAGLAPGHVYESALVETLAARAAAEAHGEPQAVPDTYWSVRPAPSAGEPTEPPGDEQVILRGVVLVRCKGHRAAPADLLSAQRGNVV